MAIIQRFGAALNLHALVLDGVYVEDGGILWFHEAMPPTDDKMDRLLWTIERRVHRLLARRGVVDDLWEGNAADPWRDEAPVLAGIAGALVQGRRAFGERAGETVRRCGASAELLALMSPPLLQGKIVNNAVSPVISAWISADATLTSRILI